jgi:serine protease Do
MGLRGGYQIMILEGEEILVGGDIILAIEGLALTNEDNLITAWHQMQDLKSGDSLTFKILRKGKVMELFGTIP